MGLPGHAPRRKPARSVLVISTMSAAFALSWFGGATATAMSTGHSGAGSEQARCGGLRSLYSLRPAFLRACGVAVYPRQPSAAADELLGERGDHAVGRDGPPASGRSFHYRGDGWQVTYRLPAAGFDVLKATPSQLASYGIPARPANPRARAAWSRNMAKLHFVAPPEFLAVVPDRSSNSSTPDFSDHWAGYVAYGRRFTKMASTWVEPSLRPSRCHTSSLTLWTGLGGYSSSSLAQDGTALRTPDLGEHQAWWEITPVGMVPVPLYATAGAPFTARVTYIGHRRFWFFMENDKTGAAWSSVESSRRPVDLTSAESIAERPCLSACTTSRADYSNLSNFGTVVFMSSRANGLPMGALPNYAESMSPSGASTGRYLAEPGRVGTVAGRFAVRQNNCS